LSVRDSDRPFVADLAKEFNDLGFKIIATKGTARSIAELDIPVEIIKKVAEGRPHVVDAMKNSEVNLIVNTTEGRQSILDSASIRRTALEEKNLLYYYFRRWQSCLFSIKKQRFVVC
jgi:carbamoyl-phosphate synthase large subunit